MLDRIYQWRATMVLRQHGFTRGNFARARSESLLEKYDDWQLLDGIYQTLYQWKSATYRGED
ncbi:hypothetical protein FC38_GL000311 [Lactobacillus gigeriorum DSM 23908 = CRBIP 24.85]|uniref:Uncharacterized protein n=1 Tax=Lactobacillus gigeriorum DSM 23908 = CRBIP 24.85 TaxID=1423751 RepID=A0ABR5PVU1_9LACO|nr:hypothetical protein FC38_GL000311 [Lactobacillus gigeriorum DSM 23908 = CRBIP 24.85]